MRASVRLIRLYGTLFSMAIRRQLAFRTNLGFEVLLTMATLVTTLAAVLALFTRTGRVGGFSVAGTVVLVGTFHVLSGLRRALVEPNLRFNGEQVATGEFDGLLLQPAPIVFLVSLGGAAPLALVQVALGLGTVVAGAARENAGPALMLCWLVLVCSAAAVMWATRTMLATTVFFSLGLSLDVVYDAVWQAAAYPTGVFATPVRQVLTWVVPVAFIATVPAAVLTGALSPAWVAAGPVVAALCVAAALALWRVALHRYTSATS